MVTHLAVHFPLHSCILGLASEQCDACVERVVKRPGALAHATEYTYCSAGGMTGPGGRRAGARHLGMVHTEAQRERERERGQQTVPHKRNTTHE